MTQLENCLSRHDLKKRIPHIIDGANELFRRFSAQHRPTVGISLLRTDGNPGAYLITGVICIVRQPASAVVYFISPRGTLTVLLIAMQETEPS